MSPALLLLYACAQPVAGIRIGDTSTPEVPTGDDDDGDVTPDDPAPDDRTAADRVAAIDRTDDPDFVYAFEQAAFVPPEGKTLLIMGQTVERIDEYLETYPDAPLPGGWSAYWGVPEFLGITEAHVGEYGTTQDHQMLVDDFPDAVVHSAMWMVGTWDVAQNTADGSYDDVIDQYAAWANTVDRPIYLRIGYEFDGWHNELEPDVYRLAYRRVVDRMRAAGVDNVAYVWHSYASPPYNGYDVADWYPGDDYVDWVGVSVFDHLYSGQPTLGSYGQAVLEFARDHAKPVIAAESSPVRGIDPDDPRAWDAWFVPFFSFVHRHDIKAIAFISEDWSTLDFPGVTWADARLMNNADVAEAWFLETSDPRYLHASPDLYDALGYTRAASGDGRR